MGRIVFTFTVCIAIVRSCAPRLSSTLPESGRLPEIGYSPIGYETVAQALESLKKKPDTKFRQKQGWIIISEEGDNALWSFTPENHPAYPAVAKRTVVLDEDGISIVLDVLCEAEKTPCDQLVRDFDELTDKIKQEMNAQN